MQEENTSLRKSHFQTANLSQELMQEVKSYHQNQARLLPMIAGLPSLTCSPARWKVEKKALLSLIMDHLSIEDDSEVDAEETSAPSYTSSCLPLTLLLPDARFQDSAERQTLYAKLKVILNENESEPSQDNPAESSPINSRPLSAKVSCYLLPLATSRFSTAPSPSLPGVDCPPTSPASMQNCRLL